MQAFIGDNTYESYSRAWDHATQLAKEEQAELVVINCDELISSEEMVQKLQGGDLFASKSIVLAKRLFANKQVAKQIITNKSLLNAPNLVVWDDTKLDKRTKMVKLLMRHNILEWCTQPKSYQIPDWIRAHAQTQWKLKLNKQQCEQIHSLVGDNLWLLANEIQKLAAISKSGKVSDEKLGEVITDYKVGNIWEFVDAFAYGDKKKIMASLGQLLTEVSDVHYLVAMITRELRIISQVKYADSQGEELKLNPYVIKKTKPKARQISWEKLKNLYKALLEFDTKLKNGELPGASALALYLLKS